MGPAIVARVPADDCETIASVPDVLVAPYLVLTDAVEVGPWKLVPFRRLDDDSDAAVLPEPYRREVSRLVEAYRVARASTPLGALVVPPRGRVGDDFDRSDMRDLGHALLVGSVADNPPMAVAEDDQDLNAGHATATSENALLYGHPLTGGNSYAVQIGVLVKVADLRYAPGDEPLPKIAPPVELPRPLFGQFDDEIAAASMELLVAGTAESRRFRRALDWCRVALSNAEAVALDVRVGAARSAIEVQTGTSDETRKVVRAYGRLMRTAETTERTYGDVFWTKGAVQLTPDEWWLTRLSELRNAIVHGDEVPDYLWLHDDLHQLNHIHDRLISMVRRVVATSSGDALLELGRADRVFPRIAEQYLADLRRRGDDPDRDGRGGLE